MWKYSSSSVSLALVAGDGRAVDQHLRRRQHAVDQQAVAAPSRRDRHAEHWERARSGRCEPAAHPPPTAWTDRSSCADSGRSIGRDAVRRTSSAANRRSRGLRSCARPRPSECVVPFRKQLVGSTAQPFPTGFSFPQFAEAGSVFDTLPSAANARIAPNFMVLRRVRCVPEFKFPNSLVTVRFPSLGQVQHGISQLLHLVTMNSHVWVIIPITPISPRAWSGRSQRALKRGPRSPT